MGTHGGGSMAPPPGRPPPSVVGWEAYWDRREGVEVEGRWVTGSALGSYAWTSSVRARACTVLPMRALHHAALCQKTGRPKHSNRYQHAMYQA